MLPLTRTHVGVMAVGQVALAGPRLGPVAALVHIQLELTGKSRMSLYTGKTHQHK